MCENGTILYRGHVDIFIELELALVSSIVSSRIFGNVVSQLEFLSLQLSNASVVSFLLCTFMLESFVENYLRNPSSTIERKF